MAKRGRPPGKVLQKALASASQAQVLISEMDSQVATMNERQRVLFESLMSGDDELKSAIRAGYNDWFTGIAKVVDTIEGDRLLTSSVTLENVESLSTQSYDRLLRLCVSKVRYLTGTDDYKQYIEPVREYIKRFAPLALGTIVGIATQGIKEENRLKAAKDILDRAGEQAAEPEKDVIVPVQVNIMLTNKEGKVVPYVG